MPETARKTIFKSLSATVTIHTLLKKKILLKKTLKPMFTRAYLLYGLLTVHSLGLSDGALSEEALC